MHAIEQHPLFERGAAMIIFENQSEFYRNPQGGVKAGQEITLKIQVKNQSAFRPKIKIEKRHDYDSLFYKEVLMEWIGRENNCDLFKGTFLIKEKGQYFYSFIINEAYSSKQYELLIYAESYNTPDWIKGGTIYHIFVDRFYKTKILNKNREDIIIRNDWGGCPDYLPDEEGEIKNNDFFGGSLEGIIEKLPYIHSLGVNTIYLSPVFDAYSNHKYDTGDYLSIDPMFGSAGTLERLCYEAEKFGIYVVLDGVFSHTGDDSIYFNKYGRYESLGAYQSKNSPYYSWYTFNKWNSDYVSWWGIKTLPALNKNNEVYIEFITGEKGVLKYWQNIGVKGWRLDVADELPNEFLEKLREAVKNQDNDAYIVGEVWEDASNKFSYGKLKEYFCGNQLDSVTNYPLKNAIINYVKSKDCKALYETLNLTIEKYPPQTVNCLMNILGTHDTARILTVLGTDRSPQTKDDKSKYKLNEEELKKGIKLLKIASLLQFTLPGVPCIYYGDEVGVEGFEDPFNRTCFPWGSENIEILNHYKFLAQLRNNKLFAAGNYKNHLHDEGVFVFERFDADKRILIAINMSNESITLKFKENLKVFGAKTIGNTFKLNTEEFLVLL